MLAFSSTHLHINSTQLNTLFCLAMQYLCSWDAPKKIPTFNFNYLFFKRHIIVLFSILMVTFISYTMVGLNIFFVSHIEIQMCVALCRCVCYAGGFFMHKSIHSFTCSLVSRALFGAPTKCAKKDNK